MLNKKLIKEKINLIQTDLLHLKDYKNLGFDEVAKNYATHKIIERIIEVIINEAIDINQHLIVELGKGRLPFDYKESFLLLAELKILPKAFAEEISQSVGLRNILVHQYRKLDEKIFYHSIKDCLKQYSQYCRYLLKYLKST
ncbi:MAG: type VII toxin-antitoxin system HepT family RNase toxin [Microgenomates group bacterium]